MVKKPVAIVLRTPDPYVTFALTGILLVREDEVPASSLRSALDRLLEKMGDRRVSVVVTSLDP